MTRSFLLSLVLSAVPASAADKQPVCLLDVTDGTGRASLPAFVKTLETELQANYTVVPNKKAARIARTKRIPRSQWLTPSGLKALATPLRFKLGLQARLTFAFGTWTLYLTAFDAATGEERGEAQVILSKPKLNADRARSLVFALGQALTRQAPPEGEPDAPQPEPTAPEPESPEAPEAPSAPSTPDVWSEAAGDFGSPQDGAGPSVAEGLRLDTTVEVGGRLGFEHYAFFENKDPTALGSRDNVEAAVRIKAVHPRVTAFASVLARSDFADASRNRFDPEEAWVEVTFPSVSVKAGRLLTTWGTANLYSPSDVLNSVDARDPLDAEKLGTLMLRVAATVGPATIEASYLPVPEAHRLPALTGIAPDGKLLGNSRWLRGSLDVTGSLPLTFHVGPFTPPPPRPSNSQGALRAEASVGGTDVGVGYAFLVDHLPSALIEAVPEAGIPLGADVYVDWAYRRLHVVAIDAERTFGKLRVAGETAAFFTADLQAQNPRVADPYMLLNLGADYQTSSFAGDQRLHFFLEFALAVPLAGKLATDGIDLSRYPFPRTLLGRVAWEIEQDLHVELNAISSLERFDLFLSPRVEYAFFDRVKARLGIDLLAGSATRGFFGPMHDNSRFIATVEAHF